MSENFKSRLTRITTMLFDLDGVFTDGRIYYPDGDEPKRSLHVKDLYALQQAVQKGYDIVVISSGRLGPIKDVLTNLGVRHILSLPDKLQGCLAFIKEHKKEFAEIMYMGDDLPDHDIMKQVGVPVCPNDAAHEIRSLSVYISSKKGGEGCVRDVVEQVLRVQNKWEIVTW
jgi:3-deoxy-D-manno-octulosonate 8-phosphate phosphatase (KDO 8-P phosphatase)